MVKRRPAHCRLFVDIEVLFSSPACVLRSFFLFQPASQHTKLQLSTTDPHIWAERNTSHNPWAALKVAAGVMSDGSRGHFLSFTAGHNELRQRAHLPASSRIVPDPSQLFKQDGQPMVSKLREAHSSDNGTSSHWALSCWLPLLQGSPGVRVNAMHAFGPCKAHITFTSGVFPQTEGGH